MTRTQVGIVGGGPAGLLLGQLLAKQGIESVLLESRDRAYAEARIRAGVLEQGTVEVLEGLGLAERLHQEGLVHRGIYMQLHGERHRIDLAGLTGGRCITVYGQQEVVKDLTQARLQAGLPLLFDAEALAIENVAPGATGPARVVYRHQGQDQVLECDLVAGCDGSHGPSLTTIPDALRRTHERHHPFAWLGVLAQVAPSTDELIYSLHQRGFALHSLRSLQLSRLYLQVDPLTDLNDWPDGRVWEELQLRLGTRGWTLEEGPVLDKGITPMRSLVVEPMSYGRLFLAGDAAHIVPPTGAKGLNLAMADVSLLAEAMQAQLDSGDGSLLATYSDRCLARVWKAQGFSLAMTYLLHLNPTDDAFSQRLQEARLRYLFSSEPARTALAENYVGLPLAPHGRPE
ncbi:MAG: 4-hydroxybenzoate 3-monooxygenase [Candidatus Dormibacteria bacterium]